MPKLAKRRTPESVLIQTPQPEPPWADGARSGILATSLCTFFAQPSPLHFPIRSDIKMQHILPYPQKKGGQSK
ncbi:hypothetical protein A2870_03990 [Candidatus Curtissbacteria bacterium RIFCSPHIGHO2_01_FULL_41_11]|uniref:Uncharacterized protein n=1 Tax=Candidatus Curtissbacteria bacterium RIFCSPHIGHO2_01_FULL_41_11 TaxID=1797711 RepID=A0A1F5G7W8_9BACT|nr:MAG: hypothetical protein A2870_03990 [Candidatus Curtissbacteria bacterium RIFCSPHIGHO2_01_FULL_41_11]